MTPFQIIINTLRYITCYWFFIGFLCSYCRRKNYKQKEDSTPNIKRNNKSNTVKFEFICFRV